MTILFVETLLVMLLAFALGLFIAWLLWGRDAANDAI
jgi:hypothetical protein